MRQVHDEVRSHGTYRHTPEQLALHRQDVLAYAAGQRPAAGERCGSDRG
jgi:hypothetical protein